MKAPSNHLLRRVAWLLLCVAVYVPVAFLLSMVVYAKPYVWYDQYLSALGLIRLPDGTPNTIASWLLFNSALVVAGIGSAVYFLVRGWDFAISSSPTWFRRIRGWLLAAFGIMGGAGLVMIGLIPYDCNPDWHNYSTYIALGGLGHVVPLCVFSPNGRFANRSVNLSWGAVAVLVGTVLCAMRDLALKGQLLRYGPCQQKLLVLGFYLFIVTHAILLFRHTAHR
ncbi:MAG: hypothetical protein J5654_11955 [Victivallales bacterium]|nr:hypothetical protein [Victivallales bacterium]